jgi:allophanate hydrolase subunit 2
VSGRSDRRGVRLESAVPAPGAAGELRSQGVLPGAVQWLPSGGLIVLGVDAPVTGGYPWIAQVIEADLGRLAQLAPGATVGFERCDPERAEAARAERERALAQGVVE